MGNDGIVLVESVEGMPGDIWVARVKMPGGSKVAVALPRHQLNPQTVIFSIQAATLLWQKSGSPLQGG